jgi:hypothetical protein
MADMKIDGVRGPSPPTGAKRGASAPAPGFAAPAASGAKISGAAPVAPTPGIDAVLALQGDEPPNRRARQARRGARTLDALDKLRLGLLQGRAPASLRAEIEALQADRADAGDEGLNALLLEIDTRAAVELAKLTLAEAGPR